MNNQIPGAPEAPPHLSAEEAWAWQSGWESGYAAFHAQLVEEFTRLRNGLMKRPPTSNRRAWNLYCDHSNDTDALAARMTTAELASAIPKLKARNL